MHAMQPAMCDWGMRSGTIPLVTLSRRAGSQSAPSGARHLQGVAISIDEFQRQQQSLRCTIRIRPQGNHGLLALFFSLHVGVLRV